MSGLATLVADVLGSLEAVLSEPRTEYERLRRSPPFCVPVEKMQQYLPVRERRAQKPVTPRFTGHRQPLGGDGT